MLSTVTNPSMNLCGASRTRTEPIAKWETLRDRLFDALHEFDPPRSGSDQLTTLAWLASLAHLRARHEDILSILTECHDLVSEEHYEEPAVIAFDNKETSLIEQLEATMNAFGSSIESWEGFEPRPQPESEHKWEKTFFPDEHSYDERIRNHYVTLCADLSSSAFENIKLQWTSLIRAGDLVEAKHMLLAMPEELIRKLMLDGRDTWTNGFLHGALEFQEIAADKGIKKFLKQYPYLSPKTRNYWALNTNCRIPHPSSDLLSKDRVIPCRALSGFIATQPPGKTNRLALFGASFEEAEIKMPATIPREIERHYKTVVEHSLMHIVRNDQYQRFFLKQIERMRSRMPPIASVRILMATSRHAMDWQITLKDNDEAVIHFADPNRTVVPLRCACSVNDLGTLTQDWFITDADKNDYWGSDTCSMFYVVPPDVDWRSAVDVPVPPDRRVAGPLPDPIDETVINYLLRGGFTLDLSDVLAGLRYDSGLPQDRLLSLLSAKNSCGIPGLHLAMKGGYVKTISVYLAGVQALAATGLITQDQLVALVAGTDGEGAPGFAFAVQEGMATTVTAYLAGVKALAHAGLITADQLTSLIAAKDTDGVYSFHYTVQGGRDSALTAYMTGVQAIAEAGLITQDQLASLVAATDAGGRSGFRYALENGNVKSIGAYLRGLQALAAAGLISQEQLMSFIIGNGIRGFPVLYSAFQEHQSEAAIAYIDAVREIASFLSGARRKQLLKALRRCQGKRHIWSFGLLVNYSDYRRLKSNHAFYRKFKLLKEALKTDSR
jgi:hypothetical protein